MLHRGRSATSGRRAEPPRCPCESAKFDGSSLCQESLTRSSSRTPTARAQAVINGTTYNDPSLSFPHKKSTVSSGSQHASFSLGGWGLLLLGPA